MIIVIISTGLDPEHQKRLVDDLKKREVEIPDVCELSLAHRVSGESSSSERRRVDIWLHPASLRHRKFFIGFLDSIRRLGLGEIHFSALQPPFETDM